MWVFNVSNPNPCPASSMAVRSDVSSVLLTPWSSGPPPGPWGGRAGQRGHSAQGALTPGCASCPPSTGQLQPAQHCGQRLALR